MFPGKSDRNIKMERSFCTDVRKGYTYELQKNHLCCALRGNAALGWMQQGKG